MMKQLIELQEQLESFLNENYRQFRVGIDKLFKVYAVSDNVIIEFSTYEFKQPSLLQKLKFGRLFDYSVYNEQQLKKIISSILEICRDDKFYVFNVEYTVGSYRGWYIEGVKIFDFGVNLGFFEYFVNPDMIFIHMSDVNLLLSRLEKGLEIEFFPNRVVKYIDINPLTPENVNTIINIINTLNSTVSIDLSVFTLNKNDGYLNIRFNDEGNVVMFDCVVNGKYFSCKRGCNDKIHKIYKLLQ